MLQTKQMYIGDGHVEREEENVSCGNRINMVWIDMDNKKVSKLCESESLSVSKLPREGCLFDHPFSDGFFHESSHFLFGLLLCAVCNTDKFVERTWGRSEGVEFKEMAVLRGYRHEGGCRTRRH